MSSEYDATEFVDGDFHANKSPFAAISAGSGAAARRAPTREEVDSRVAEAQQKLAELKRAQEDLERERSALEETRRRQMEFQTGRQEMLEHLTRGLGLLEESEFNARAEAEQMAKAILGLREALSKVEALQEEAWTKNDFAMELTRALTTLENARMEWNTARLKFPILVAPSEGNNTGMVKGPARVASAFGAIGFGELCRLGFALTWPLAGVVLLALGVLVALLLRR